MEVSYEPDEGIVSRTARVPMARWNFKEAAGKALAQRNKIAYEAVKLDKRRISLKSDTCMESLAVDAGVLRLKRRGHNFCRYADDSNVYVRSPSAGELVLKSLTRFLERRLRLKT